MKCCIICQHHQQSTNIWHDVSSDNIVSGIFSGSYETCYHCVWWYWHIINTCYVTGNYGDGDDALACNTHKICHDEDDDDNMLWCYFIDPDHVTLLMILCSIKMFWNPGDGGLSLKAWLELKKLYVVDTYLDLDIITIV